MGGGDRLFQANPSKFGPQPPAILYATQPTKDTVDGTEASVEMQSSLNGAKSDVLMNTAVVVVEKSALTQDVVRMIKATLQVQHCDIACLFLVSFLFLSADRVLQASSRRGRAVCDQRRVPRDTRSLSVHYCCRWPACGQPAHVGTRRENVWLSHASEC